MKLSRFSGNRRNEAGFLILFVEPASLVQLGALVPDLESLLTGTIDNIVGAEREFRDHWERWFSLRIRPYKTLDNKIDGAILTLVDIDSIKRAKRLAEDIVATTREPLVVLDADLRIQTASRSFYRLFQLTQRFSEVKVTKSRPRATEPPHSRSQPGFFLRL